MEVGFPGTSCRVLDFSDVSESDCESNVCVKDMIPAARKKLTQTLKQHVVTPNAAIGGKEKHVDEIVCWNYKNTPAKIDSWLATVLQSWNGKGKARSKGKISQLDSRVMKLPHLKICPNKFNKKTCNCVEMSHGAAAAFQDDVRTMYCRVIQESSRDMGNRFLMAMMVPGTTKSDCGLVFKIPGFTFDYKVRIFYLCRPQFCALFGLSTKRLYKLIRLRKEELINSNVFAGDDEILFGWQRRRGCFIIGGTLYSAFRSEHWMEYMIRHGCYGPNDSLDYEADDKIVHR
jgi:hypothetical protein